MAPGSRRIGTLCNDLMNSINHAGTDPYQCLFRVLPTGSPLLHRFMRYEEFIKYIGTGKQSEAGKQKRCMTEQRSQHIILNRYVESTSPYLQSITSGHGGHG